MSLDRRGFLRNTAVFAAMAGCRTPGVLGAEPTSYFPPTSQNYSRLAEETEAVLRKDVLGVWFPRTVDNENGGFRSNFARDWKPVARGDGKFSVFQGRMTWISSQVVMRRPDLKMQFEPFVKHGVDYLRNAMWDKQYGGFYWGLTDKGEISPFYTDGKHLYGMSFCVYGLAAAYQATKDPAALDLARRAFRWIDEHAHDAQNGGYFEWLTRQGKPVGARTEAGKIEFLPVAGFPIGYKSMNTHIHLLEAFSQLYEVWKDDLLGRRLEELLASIRDKICVEPGAMNLYFTSRWEPLPGHDSYGHDVETAFLMLEAEDALALGRHARHDPNHAHDARTERMAKILVDHALAYGWDENLGGFFDEGGALGKAEIRHKEWWVQAEGLNALLLMHEKYGAQDEAYFKAFQRQWEFIKKYQVDAEYGGLYPLVGEDGKPVDSTKGSIWKAAYHDGRALLNVSDRLRRLASTAPAP